eukprot:gnl/MRDRNA2_/MRDRNA2_73054_c0_seq3.p1 gnl/MRDRNA2_/MRDRNA2_73054_c0~~gnl/MRDRNA2_/MRDRNA2_73054_c0_seq3.p1  ORF type:complete len:749 (+),score=133.49 gnl/MRDRNA2_/MRDRNA2_73054_c0_seq3:81-2249(+)
MIPDHSWESEKGDGLIATRYQPKSVASSSEVNTISLQAQLGMDVTIAPHLSLLNVSEMNVTIAPDLSLLMKRQKVEPIWKNREIEQYQKTVKTGLGDVEKKADENRQVALVAGVVQVQTAVEVYLNNTDETVGKVMGAIDPESKQHGLMKTLFDAMTRLGEKEPSFSSEALQFIGVRYTGLLQDMKVRDFFNNDCISKTRIISLPERTFANLKTKVAQGDCNHDHKVAPELFRPSVASCTKKSFSDLQTWSRAWMKFILEEDHTCKTGKGAYQYFPGKAEYPDKYRNEAEKPCKGNSMFDENMKYPIATAIMYLYILDGLLLHATLQAKGVNINQVRTDACLAFVSNKDQSVAKVLTPFMTGDRQADVITLVEVGNVLPSIPSDTLAQYIHMMPADMADQDQNSVVLVKKSRFTRVSDQDPERNEECTATYEKDGKGKDIFKWRNQKCKKAGPFGLRELVMGAFRDKESEHVSVFAAFHAGTSGKESSDVVNMVSEESAKAGHRVLIGMDANTFADTYADPKKEAPVGEFYKDIQPWMRSVFYPKGEDYRETPEILATTATTNKIRSKVQPQPAKGKPQAAMKNPKEVDHHPKDHIVFSKQWAVESVERHNHITVSPFDPEIFMPNFEFPSDHALIAATFSCPSHPQEKTLKMVHWNIAAVNDNPFEYWMKPVKPTQNLHRQHRRGDTMLFSAGMSIFSFSQFIVFSAIILCLHHAFDQHTE